MKVEDIDVIIRFELNISLNISCKFYLRTSGELIVIHTVNQSTYVRNCARWEVVEGPAANVLIEQLQCTDEYKDRKKKVKEFLSKQHGHVQEVIAPEVLLKQCTDFDVDCFDIPDKQGCWEYDPIKGLCPYIHKCKPNVKDR